MTANGATSDWTTDVIEFLSRNLPAVDSMQGWIDKAMTAYQIGCMALAALGQADETNWGASKRAKPQLPAILPRWDDICIAVLWLAEQHHLLEIGRAHV